HAPRRRRVLAPGRRQRPVDHGEERAVDEGVSVDEEQAGARLGGLLDHAFRIRVRGAGLCLEYTPPARCRASTNEARGSGSGPVRSTRRARRRPATTRSDRFDHFGPELSNDFEMGAATESFTDPAARACARLATPRVIGG